MENISSILTPPLRWSNGIRRSSFSTSLTIPVKFKPRIGNPEMSFSYNLFRINGDRKMVIHNLVAAHTNQIDVSCNIPFIPVFRFIELQDFDYTMSGKFVESGVDCR